MAALIRITPKMLRARVDGVLLGFIVISLDFSHMFSFAQKTEQRYWPFRTSVHERPMHPAELICRDYRGW